MYVYYDTAKVKTVREIPIYDIPGFLSAAAGSISLYFGFSFLHILYDTVDKWSERSEKKKKMRDDGDETMISTVSGKVPRTAV